MPDDESIEDIEVLWEILLAEIICNVDNTNIPGERTKDSFLQGDNHKQTRIYQRKMKTFWPWIWT